jgi:hypothetical protein
MPSMPYSPRRRIEAGKSSPLSVAIARIIRVMPRPDVQR